MGCMYIWLVKLIPAQVCIVGTKYRIYQADQEQYIANVWYVYLILSYCSHHCTDNYDLYIRLVKLIIAHVCIVGTTISDISGRPATIYYKCVVCVCNVDFVIFLTIVPMTMDCTFGW